MSSSFALTNYLFCVLAALLILPLLKSPNILTYKKGFPILIAISLIIIKLLVPYEFPFTHTLASKNILPIIKQIIHINLFKNITVGNLFGGIWSIVAMLLFIYTITMHWRLMRILSIVSSSTNIELAHILSELCTEKKIKNKPKIVQLDIKMSPFITGFRTPIIVLPFQLSTDEAKFILMHELEHLTHHHIIVKAFIEIFTIIYWWNPLVWLLRKNLIRALELQADSNVIKDLSNKAGLTYLETLVNISKNAYIKRNTNLSLPFALKNNMVEYRVRTILMSTYTQKNKKTFTLHACLLTLSIMLWLFSFTYTFESYSISPMMAENTFSIDTKTDYFKLRQDQLYDLYINGNYILTMDSIPDDLSKLPIHK